MFGFLAGSAALATALRSVRRSSSDVFDDDVRRGESVLVHISSNPLDPSMYTDFVKLPQTGAVTTFEGAPSDFDSFRFFHLRVRSGTTRNSFEEKAVVTLSYEAYTSMALTSLLEICERVLAEFDDVERAAVGHRVGTVAVLETSIVVCISSGHRKQGFLACAALLDALKAEAPLWKKEIYADDAPRWKEN